MTQPAQVVNRGQLLALLGAVRLADGTYELANTCPSCGATKLRIAWERAAGIAGVIHHEAEDGCEMSTGDIIPDESKPVTEAPKLEVVAPPKAATGSDDAIVSIRFRDPVECGAVSGLQSWSRLRDSAVQMRIEPPFVILTSKTMIARVPFHNVAYISEKR